MKILVRLPNWLGDMVMSYAFIDQLQKLYPESKITVIVKNGLEPLLEYFPSVKPIIFSKNEFKGLAGAYRFGKKIKKEGEFDLFFSLPDSFSSAVMGYASGAKKRIGYKKELRSFLLTNSYSKNKNLHRVQQYLQLLENFSGKTTMAEKINFKKSDSKNDNIIININSEASSRRLPKEKAIKIIEKIRENSTKEILLIGAANDKPYVDEVYISLKNKTNIENVAGNYSLKQLTEVLSSAATVLTTDSGPAHLANATGTHTVVLFGAGDEKETSPWNKENLSVVRLGQLPCEPCRDNVCKIYGTPKCLTLLSEEMVLAELLKQK